MNYELLIELHKNNPRQGPGSALHTKQALELSGLLERTEHLKIADIGCGSGAATLTLAQYLKAEITAVDLSPEFLDILKQRAQQQGLNEQIKTLTCSMDDLPFAENSFDAIWSEGAIYNIGFEKGISYFKRFLKPGGLLALSEITWLTTERPSEVTDYWQSQYPEIASAADKIAILQAQDFIIKGYFPLPKACWLDQYYLPLQDRFDAFLTKYDTTEAKTLIDAEISEIDFYQKYCDYYSYGFYIAQKV